ncbi:unnamed protein product [Rotaria sp. Silwood2]|nr:unnamed protein product [Rotaria sp. Silwood2]
MLEETIADYDLLSHDTLHSQQIIKDINRQTRNRWLMNMNMILRCLVQNLTEDAKLTQWNDVVSSVNLTRDEMFKNGKDPNNINNTNSMTSSKDSLITSNTDKDLKKDLMVHNLDINRQTINRWLMNINMILRCLVQNLTEDAKLTQWNDVVSSVNLTRDEMFSVALLHILHDAVLQILTNTRQLPTEQIKTGFYQSQKSLSFHHNRYDIKHFRTIVLLNLHQLAIISPSSAETKSSNVSSLAPLNNTSTNINAMTIRQLMIYLFDSRHVSSINSDQSKENSAIRE